MSEYDMILSCENDSELYALNIHAFSGVALTVYDNA